MDTLIVVVGLRPRHRLAGLFALSGSRFCTGSMVAITSCCP